MRTPEEGTRTYKIIRFHRDKPDGTIGPRPVIRRGLTLKQAQEHCSREDTHKVNQDGTVVWFDGYTEE
jgi:hypothetical protein